MQKNIEEKTIIPNKKKKLDISLSKNQRSIPNKNKSINPYQDLIKKKEIEDKISLKEELRKRLRNLKIIREKAKKRVFKKMLSKKKDLFFQIKNNEKKTLLNGKNIIEQIKSKAKKNSLSEKNVIDQIKSKEKNNRLAEKKIIDQINSEKKVLRLAEKKIIDQIKKILDQRNSKKRKKSSNQKKIFNEKKKKRNLENIKKISDKKKILAKTNIKKRKLIFLSFNEKIFLIKKIIEERQKIYDEKKALIKKSIEEKRKISNKKKILAKRIIEEKTKIYNVKNFIAQKLLKEKTTLFYKKKKKAFQNIKKIKLFWRMWQARLQLGEQRRVWNPKMAPYIFPTTKSPYQIINLVKTYKCLKKISRFLYKAASKKKTVLFVGTSHSDLIINAAGFSKSFWITQRWLGGILTNWKTIKNSNKKFRSIRLKDKLKTIPLHLRLKKIYRDILEKHSVEKPTFLKDKEKIVLLFDLFKDEKEKRATSFCSNNMESQVSLLSPNSKKRQATSSSPNSKEKQATSSSPNSKEKRATSSSPNSKEERATSSSPNSKEERANSSSPNSKEEKANSFCYNSKEKQVNSFCVKEFNLLEEKDKSTLLEYKKELKVITAEFKSQALPLLKDPSFQNLPKKQAATKQREKERFKRYFNGLTCLRKIPDIVIIVGQLRQSNAVRECQKLGLKSITILDTDCEPTLTDSFVPANDDSSCSIQLLLTIFSKAIQKGRKEFKKKPKKKKKKRLPWFARKRKKKKVVSFRVRKTYRKFCHKMPVIPEFLEFVP